MRCAEAILSVNPDLLICVQGMHEYGGETTWWGGNLMGVTDHPLVLSVPNRLVYSIHDYGPNVWVQPWHNDPAFPTNLPGFWDRQWGFVHDQGIAPIWIGEWGTKFDNTKENQWAVTLRDYIRSKGLSWTWWCWTPNSHDTGGILADDWNTPIAAKLDLIESVLYPGFGPTEGGVADEGGGDGGGGQTPYGGVPRPIPGVIQAEDFDEGGEGVAYHDADPVNHGGQYRSTGVDIEALYDGSGYNVGWIEAGEWLEYTVQVQTAGTYEVDARVASALNGGTFHIQFDGVNKTGTIAAPSTGGWQTWTTVTRTEVELSAGLQVMRIAFDSGPFNIDGVEFRLTAAAPGSGGDTSGGGSTGGGGNGGGSGTGEAGAGGEGGGSPSGGGRSSSGGCGATGMGAILVFGLGALLRRWRRR